MRDDLNAEQQALLATLRIAQSNVQRQQIFERLLVWPPAQVRAIVAELKMLGTPVRDMVRASGTVRFLLKGKVQAYREVQPDASVRLFSSTEQKIANKTLLVVFTGAHKRPMLPHCVFLQALSSAEFDVAMLTDPDNLHFSAGLNGGADTLPGVVAHLAGTLNSAAYRRVITLGTSSGGFPALRAGILMRAERAVSIGGRPIWWPERLRRNSDLPSPFDMLCACCPETQTRLICVYAGQNEQDRVAAHRLSSIVPVERIDMAHAVQHNLLHRAMLHDRLPQFLDTALNGDPARLPHIHRSPRAAVEAALQRIFPS